MGEADGETHESVEGAIQRQYPTHTMLETVIRELGCRNPLVEKELTKDRRKVLMGLDRTSEEIVLPPELNTRHSLSDDGFLFFVLFCFVFFVFKFRSSASISFDSSVICDFVMFLI